MAELNFNVCPACSSSNRIVPDVIPTTTIEGSGCYLVDSIFHNEDSDKLIKIAACSDCGCVYAYNVSY